MDTTKIQGAVVFRGGSPCLQYDNKMEGPFSLLLVHRWQLGSACFCHGRGLCLAEAQQLVFKVFLKSLCLSGIKLDLLDYEHLFCG